MAHFFKKNLRWISWLCGSAYAHLPEALDSNFEHKIYAFCNYYVEIETVFVIGFSNRKQKR